MRQHPLRNKKTGSALLTALFIMTLVAIAATAMSVRLQLDIYRTQLLITHDKLYLASQSVMFWALDELNNKNNKFTKVTAQGMVLNYPQNIKNIYKGVTLNGGLYDLQARYNLNNMLNKKLLASFGTLVNRTYPAANDNEKIAMTYALQDWLSTYDLARGKDSFTAYYLAQKPAYYPSHQLMTSASELRLVKDVSAKLNQAMQPFITALPEATPININTASQTVLMTLGSGLNSEQVNELIEVRGAKGIRNVTKLRPILQKLNIPQEQITTESHYFLSVAYAKSDDLELIVYALLKRSSTRKGVLSVSVLRQSINSW